MPEISVGLVGYGMGGSLFHAPLIQSVPELRLSAVVTSRKDLVAQSIPAARVLPNLDALLAESAIELVVVSSPTNSHFDVARSALLAGKHVVVDKPFATSVRQADLLLALAESKNLLLSVFQNRRWDGDFLTVQKCIGDGTLGTVYHYEAHYDRFRPQIKEGWREETGRGSGILYDLGAHLIDQALVLFGMPSAVTSQVFPQRTGAQADDYFNLVLDYGRRATILHGALLVRQPGPHFAVHGDAGSFLKFGMDSQEEALKAGKRPGAADWGADVPANYGTLTLADGTTKTVETLRGSYEAFYQQIAAALLNNGPLPVNPAESRDGLIVIEAALRSAAERRTVAIL